MKINQQTFNLNNDMYDEETSFFKLGPIHTSPDAALYFYNEFLSYHGKKYYSNAKPLWLYEVKNLASIGTYSFVQVRDGLLTLLNFFEQFPEPENIITKLLIKSNLSYIIPDAWEKNVYLYDNVLAHDKNHFEDKLKKSNYVFLLVTPDEGQYPIKAFRKKLQEIKKTLNFLENKKAKIFCVMAPTPHILIGMNKPKENIEPYEFSKALALEFQDNFEFITYEKLLSMKLSESAFIDLNLNNFFYSDSSLVNQLLSKGATPLNLSEYECLPDHNDIQTLVSLNHGVKLHNQLPSDFDKLNATYKNLEEEAKRIVLGKNNNVNEQPYMVHIPFLLKTKYFYQWAIEVQERLMADKL